MPFNLPLSSLPASQSFTSQCLNSSSDLLVKALGAVYLPFHFLQADCLPFRRCPILIVAPTSVLTNWQREFNTWGAFRVALCHGKQEVRAAMLQGVQNGQFEILITSYDTFRCSEHNQPWLFDLPFACLTVSQPFSGQLLGVSMCPIRALYDDRWSTATSVSMCCSCFQAC